MKSFNRLIAHVQSYALGALWCIFLAIRIWHITVFLSRFIFGIFSIPHTANSAAGHMVGYLQAIDRRFQHQLLKSHAACCCNALVFALLPAQLMVLMARQLVLVVGCPLWFGSLHALQPIGNVTIYFIVLKEMCECS